jgi:hypothetical protein
MDGLQHHAGSMAAVMHCRIKGWKGSCGIPVNHRQTGLSVLSANDRQHTEGRMQQYHSESMITSATL